jgi:uncharacterized protein (DUF58 family)
MKWLAGVVLLLLLALTLESSLLAYASYLLLALLLLTRVLARTWAGNLRATRRLNRLTADVGDQVRVSLQIHNAGFLPVPWVLLEDMLPQTALRQKPPRLEIEGKRLQIRRLSARTETTMRYKLECRMRGYYQIGPLVMETGDLFGLHRRYKVDAEPQYLLIYPRVVALTGYDLASRRPIGDIRLMHRLYEDPTRIAGVRPYESGDPLSRVHWKATARTGALHCKVYEPSSLAGLTLVLDFHKSSFHRRGEPFRSELAVTTAASLASAVCEMGQQVGLITNGRDVADRLRLEGVDPSQRSRTAARTRAAEIEESDRLRPQIVATRHGAEQFQRIRETLARVELTDGLSSSQLVAEAASRMPRDATVVALLAAVPIEAALAFGSLVRQGFAVAVVLIALDENERQNAYGRLASEGIMDVREVKEENEIPELCRQQLRRTTPYQLQDDFRR